MDSFQEIKNLIEQSKSIYILPAKDCQEIIASALALFYTLKELNKNVNLMLEEVPERLKFLIPSLNYISYPRNFSLSIPNSKTEISQIRYEKNEQDLKVYLTIEKGNIKKSDISFCFVAPKADVLLTVGLKEFERESDNDILSSASIINISNKEGASNFGLVNLIKPGYPLAQMLINFIKSINEGGFSNKNTNSALLASLIIFSDNFQNQKTSPELLESAAFLIKKGAERQEILENLYK